VYNPKSKIVLLIFCILAAFCLTAQNKYNSRSRKAIAKFESALYQYKLGNFELSKNELAVAIKIDPAFIDAYILLGEIANEEGNKGLAVAQYEKAISMKPGYKPFTYIRIAEILQGDGRYEEARKYYFDFLPYQKLEKEYTNYVNQKIKQCDYAIEMMKRPVPFNPINLGPRINTALSEYWPILTADDSLLVFTSSDRLRNSQEDLYYSTRNKDGWDQATLIAPPVNSKGSEGAQTISADGRIMVFTACLRTDGFGSCDLYISRKSGNEWSKPLNMGKNINTSYKESQPSLSSDGKTIYFASNRPGGKGKFDIWQSRLNDDGNWSVPINLGDSINTDGEDFAPFIHYDNQTLYFSSDGHPGMGGTDIFISRKDESGNWSKAKNAGYPINTHFSEESLVVDAYGTFGLFSSDMDGGYGQKDIYKFEIPTELRPRHTIFIKGLVYNAKTMKPLQAEISISIFADRLSLQTESDGVNGNFLICLPPGKNYAFHVNKAGYMIFSESYFFSDTSLFVRIPLEPIEKGKTTTLKNIFFDFDSHEIKEESYPELNKLADFIEKNKTIIEIQGHTDNIGSQPYNLQLSHNRAKAVYDYLIKKGINPELLKFKGYGSSMPVADNQTESGRSKNRRTDFLILGRN
jgi:flagellar motor protein MotB/Tfp pilus assembly protein PilF